MSYDIFKHEYRDPSGHTPSEGGKTQEKHHPGLPGNARPRVRPAVAGQTGFLHAVDYEHAQAGEDEGKPVNKSHVGVGTVEGRLGPDCAVEEGVEGEGELRAYVESVVSGGWMSEWGDSIGGRVRRL